MKRFLLIGTVFCAAAFVGLGLALMAPTDAGADPPCDEFDRQDWFDCPSDTCPPNLPNAKYDCGTDYKGKPCNCQFVGCYRGCFNPI